MNNKLSDNEVIALLILVFATLIKVIYSTTTYYTEYIINYTLGERFYKFIHRTKNFYSSLIDLTYVIIGIYFIFIRKTRNIFFLVAFYALIFKAFMHFLIRTKIYKFLNLSAENENKLLKFKIIETIITNYILFFLTLYILKVVFI